MALIVQLPASDGGISTGKQHLHLGELGESGHKKLEFIIHPNSTPYRGLPPRTGKPNIETTRGSFICLSGATNSTSTTKTVLPSWTCRLSYWADTIICTNQARIPNEPFEGFTLFDSKVKISKPTIFCRYDGLDLQYRGGKCKFRDDYSMATWSPSPSRPMMPRHSFNEGVVSAARRW